MNNLDLAASLLWRLRRFSRRIWVRTTLFAVLAVLANVAAWLIGPAVRPDLAAAFQGEALVDILTILSSSMLAVTIFAVSTVVSVRQSASSQATPRAYRLLLRDPTTQTVLATFLGAFVFSLVSLILVRTGFYADGGESVIMFVTVFVTGLIVLAMLRWIVHISGLGSIVETTSRAETVATQAIDDRRGHPRLGAAAPVPLPPGAKPVMADRTGYVAYVDLGRLAQLAGNAGGRVHLAVTPGDLVASGRPIAHVEGDVPASPLRGAVAIGPHREFEQDPRFGLRVLSEIAQRALSPGINDPGTALDVLSRLMALTLKAAAIEDPAEDDYPDVHMPAVPAAEFVETAFAAIARAQSRRALALADAALELPSDMKAIRAAAPVGRAAA